MGIVEGEMAKAATGMARLVPPAERVAQWVNAKDAKSLDPRDLSAASPDVDDALALAKEIGKLVQAGTLSCVYKVITPSGIESDEFLTPAQIPVELLQTASDIVPVYRVN